LGRKRLLETITSDLVKQYLSEKSQRGRAFPTGNLKDLTIFVKFFTFCVVIYLTKKKKELHLIKILFQNKINFEMMMDK